jgi:hypothetical protein
MQELMALGYTPMMALTIIFGTGDVAPVILQAIVSGETADCATDGDCAVTRGGVVLGKYPKYTQVATDIEGKVFSVPTDKWNALTADQQWELNKGFLDQAVKRGDYIYLVSKWSKAKGWYGRELQYLFSLGYTISPNQVWLIPPGQ